MRRALISTITPISGGVPQMAKFIAETLREGGIEPAFAYYQPYSITPRLSVPAYKLFTRTVGIELREYAGSQANSIGAWLPELEFTHYLPGKHWRKLMSEYDFHLSVSGNCLAATPYALTKRAFWSWVATDWGEDREQRVQAFSWYRKLVDRLVNSRGARALERKVLDSGGRIVALSRHTLTMLNDISRNRTVKDVMPMGIDTKLFREREARSGRPPTIGFVGRLDDPRKNIELLLEAVSLYRRNDTAISAVLIGGAEAGALEPLIQSYGLESSVTVVEYIEHDNLPRLLNDLDVFVIPSHQEGLCIAALEAMSCGIPVISTRCGGPEEFVLVDETGYLVDSNPDALASALANVFSNESLRLNLGGGARKLVENYYSIDHVKKIFWSLFNGVFGAQK